MKFEIHGPFELPLDGTVQSNKKVRADFVDQTSASEYKKGSTALSSACGCYVFAIRAGRGILPWYVGKAERTPFGKECLTDRNINTYNLLLKNRAGTPLMYLLAEMTGGGKFAKTTSKTTNVGTTPIDFLETMLIRMAIKRNKDLTNIGKTKMVRELEVVGLMNTKRLARGGVASELRRVFGLKNK